MKAPKTLIIALLLASLVACGSSEETAADFVNSGNKLYQKGEYDKARLEYKNAIQIDPRQAEPYYKLALIDEKKQNYKEMFANLRAVIELNPKHKQALVKIGRIYLLSGNNDEAMKSADKALAVDANDVDAMVLKASVLTKQKKYKDALAEIDKALKQKPDDLGALSLQIIVYQDQGDDDKALSLLNAALQKYPHKLTLQMVKLGIFQKQKNYAGMASVYRDIIKRDPDKRGLVTAYAQLLNNALGKYDEAKKVLSDYIAKHPKENDIKLTYISLIKSKNVDEALAQLDQYIAADKQNFDFRFAKVDILLNHKQNDKAEAEIKSILADKPEGKYSNRAKVLEAALAAIKGNYAEAEKTVQSVLDATPEETDALMLMARLQMRKGNYDQVITDLRTALHNEPNSSKALILLAQAYEKSGSQQLAEDTYRKLLDVDPQNTIAALSVARDAMKNNNLDNAEDVLVKALKAKPDNKKLLEALAQVRIMKQDWDGSSQAISDLKKQGGDTAFSHMLSGQVLQGQQDYLAAIKEYQAALALNPKMTPALQGIAASYDKLGDKKSLLNYLTQFVAKNPDQYDGYAILALVYQHEKQYDKAVATVNQSLKKHPDWVGGYRLLAGIYQQQNDTQKIIETYKTALTKVPGNEQLELQLGMAYEAGGDYDKAKTHYENVVAKNSKQKVAVNNLASLLTDHFATPKNLQKALKLASEFKNATNPYFLDTYGWVNTKLGHYDVAEPALVRAVNLAGNIAIFPYHLGMMYSKMGKKDDAKKYLQQAQKLISKQGDGKLKKQIEQALSEL